MRKKSTAIALLAALLCIFSNSVFADIAGPTSGSSSGVLITVLIIAVLLVAVLLVIRHIRKGR